MKYNTVISIAFQKHYQIFTGLIMYDEVEYFKNQPIIIGIFSNGDKNSRGAVTLIRK